MTISTYILNSRTRIMATNLPIQLKLKNVLKYFKQFGELAWSGTPLLSDDGCTYSIHLEFHDIDSTKALIHIKKKVSIELRMYDSAIHLPTNRFILVAQSSEINC